MLYILVACLFGKSASAFFRKDMPRTMSHRSRALLRERAAVLLRQAGAILIYVKRTVGARYNLTHVIEARIALSSK
jgi:putative copper export protein